MRRMSLIEGTKLARINPLPSISIYLKSDQKDLVNDENMRDRVKELLKGLEGTIKQKYGQIISDRMMKPLRSAVGSLKVEPNYAGLAIYHSEEVTAAINLPSHVEDFAVAADSFHLKPILRLSQTHRPHLLLSFKSSSAKLYRVTADEVNILEKIDLTNVSGEQKFLSKREGGGRLTSTFILNTALGELDKRLRIFVSRERLPLVLAGDAAIIESFRGLCKYSNILKLTLDQNLEFFDERSIGRCSMNLVERHFELMSEQNVQAYMKAKAISRTSTDLVEIAEAAVQGQVQHLFIAEDQHLWGHYDRATGKVEVVSHIHTGDLEDIYDDIAELVILKGGTVTVLPTYQMPDGLPIAATLGLTNNVIPMLSRKAESSCVSPPKEVSIVAQGYANLCTCFLLPKERIRQTCL